MAIPLAFQLAKRLILIIVTVVCRVSHSLLQAIQVSIRSNLSERSENFLLTQLKLWHSLIWSTRGKTVYPYCQYIHTVTLSSLEGMLTSIDWLFIPEVKE